MKYDKEIEKILNELYGPYPGVMVPTTEKEIESHNQAMGSLGKYGYRLAMVLDPTGILSIPDLVSSIVELQKNPKDPVNYFIVAMCLICVIPIMRYTGASIKSLIWTGKVAQALPMFQSAIAVILGGIIESAGFVVEILNQIDDQNQKQITIDALKWCKENISEKDMENLANALKANNK